MEEVPQQTDSVPPPLLQAEEDATSGSSSNAPMQLDNLSPAVVDDQAIVPNTPTKVAEEEEDPNQTASDVLPAVQEMAQELADELAQGQQRTGDISGGYSTSSSLYGGSLSLIGTGGGADASIGDGRTRSIIGLAPTLGGGTLSPPHTLVNSDGASMRVHTGSIRERNFNRRISAIHEDDSDVYSESRRSDSMIFSQTQQPSVSPSGRRHQANYQSHHGRRRQNNNSIRHQRRVSEDDNSCMPRLLSESDCLSIVSGISEGGASTTRVRLATDRAYDALRIGAPPAVIAAAGGGGGQLGFGYIHHYQGGSNQYPHRAMSFATSSDPGLPSTGSFYDYYLDPNDYVPNSGSTRDGDHEDDDDDDRDSDDSSECGHRHHHRRRRRRDDEDIVSLIRSDIAVYGSAVDDVKFPFLPDNFSEFSGSVVYSPNGAIGTDCGDRGLRELTEAYYAPQYQQQSQSQSPQQQQHHHQQSSEQNGSRASSNKKSRRGKDRLIIRNGKTRDLPSNTGDPITVMANTGGGSSQIRGNSSTSRAVRAVAAAGLPGPSNRPSRHYRRQSASEAYPSTTTVTVVAVASTSTAAAGAGIRQANSNSNSPAIRPNALMRFFKRITPKN
ncbi:hypothetical protein GGI17_004670 [Coemansia sp. S146]|nr:hypothetical protein GGI17_004670 [Coemansia sp. S146]